MGNRLRFLAEVHNYLLDLELVAQIGQALELVAADERDAWGLLQVHVVYALGHFEGDRVAAIPARLDFRPYFLGQLAGAQQHDALVEQAAAEHERITEAPGNDRQDDDGHPYQKNAGRDDRLGEGEVEERQDNGRYAQRLDQPQGQILEIGLFLQIVEIVVIEGCLTDKGDHEQLQVKPLIIVQGLFTLEQYRRQQDGGVDGHSFADHEEDVPNRIVLAEETEH